MEIGPIPGSRSLPAVQPNHAGPVLPDVDRAENTSRAGDDTYSPNRGKPSRGQDADATEPEGDSSFGPQPSVPEEPSESTISYFA